jgi:hypothetical protein
VPAIAFPVRRNSVACGAAVWITQTNHRSVSIALTRLLNYVDFAASLQHLHIESAGAIRNRALHVHSSPSAFVASDFDDRRATIVYLNSDLAIDLSLPFENAVARIALSSILRACRLH